MQQQSVGTSLAPILFLIGLVIVLVSPRKLKTLGRMVVALLGLALVLLLAGALFRKGDAEMLGALIAQIAIGAADAVGFVHVLSLKRSRQAELSATEVGKKDGVKSE